MSCDNCGRDALLTRIRVKRIGPDLRRRTEEMDVCPDCLTSMLLEGRQGKMTLEVWRGEEVLNLL